MYNFRMSKIKQNEILRLCNFSELQEFIFNNLVEEKTRSEVYKLVKEKYDKCSSSVDKQIKIIAQKINDYKNEESFVKYKLYIHKFPNGKKYVGVCQNCNDRWNNGNGYADNREMYDDIKKYGWDNIEHKIVYETSDSYLAYLLETILIDELDLISNGYNKK